MFLTHRAYDFPPANKYPGPWCVYLLKSPQTFTNYFSNVVAWRIFANELSGNALLAALSTFGTFSRRVTTVGVCVTDDAKPQELSVRPLTEYELLTGLKLLRTRPRRKRIGRDPRPFDQIVKEDPKLARKIIERWLLRTRSFTPTGLDRPADLRASELDAATWLVPKASRVLAQVPHLMLTHHRWTPGEHLHYATSALWALRYAIRMGAAETTARHADYLDLSETRIRYEERDHNRTLLAAHGLRCEECYHFPLAGSPARIPMEDYTDVHLPALTAASAAFLENLPPGAPGALLSELWHTFSEEALTAINGGQPMHRYSMDRETRVLWNLVHHDQWPTPGAAPQRLRDFLDLASSRYVASDDRTLSPAALRDLMRQVGLDPAPRGALTVGPRS